MPLPAPSRPTRPAPHPPLVIDRPPAGLDKATWKRLRAGRLLPARRLDLHGHTTARAYDAFIALLAAARAEHWRCIEIITGRGRGETGGVIRREFALWLNLPHIRPVILAATHPHPANPGSVVLLLRR